ncbi:50S ribosomal protein L6 [Buchnera aphidicola (Tetraneura ulmi)]|uniref:50S ribosomal protein L6 n=1 Tax=Buchnera aphidicola TaxID=9 RepID=UPI0034647D09
MSRIIKRPIIVPSGVSVFLNKELITIKFKDLELSRKINKNVKITFSKNFLSFDNNSMIKKEWANVGTTRSLVYSMIIGITVGFHKKLNLVGVGYRMSLKKENVLILSLGYSHNIEYIIPSGIIVKLPSPTEVVLFGRDKQLVGQVAANLRSYRIPEVYKGKGIRYENEVVKIKEAKKK